METTYGWGDTVYACFIEYLFLFQMVQKLSKLSWITIVIVENIVERFS